MIYSIRHDDLYVNLIAEMLQHAGFQDSVRDRLRLYRYEVTETRARVIDDLFDVYLSEPVTDD